jgi:hypothetical protein
MPCDQSSVTAISAAPALQTINTDLIIPADVCLVNSADTSLAEFEIRQAWDKYQTVEHHGLAFGKVCYEWREKFSAQGSRTGGGLAQILRKLGIKAGKVYYWIAEYEILIGVRQPKPQPELESEPESDLESGKPNVASYVTSSPAKKIAEKTEPAEIANGGFWEDLYHRLNTLVPSISDGAEHMMVTMLKKMTTEPVTTQAESNYRKYTVSLLEQISKDFAGYAKALKLAEVV